MNIQRTQFKVNNLISVKLNKRFNYPVSNINILCQYLNRKTYLTNKRYFELIPEKVVNLRELKNTLLQLKHYLTTETQQDYFKRETWFKTHYPNEYKRFTEMGIIKPLTTEQIKMVYGVKHATKYKDKNHKKKSRKRTTGGILFYIDDLNHTIAVINERIKELWHDYDTKTPLLEFNITLFDLQRMKENRQTQNVKRATFFYLRKLKLKRISNTAHVYLNNKIIRRALDNYQEKEMINDIDATVYRELNNFDKWFLTKTL